MIRLLIADDHKILLEGMASLFDQLEDIQVVSKVSNAKQAISFLETNADIDIVLMDINMPVMNGIEGCKYIIKTFPKVRVIALSSYNKHSYINRMLKNGASGYILKNANAEDIEKGIRDVYDGNKHIPTEVMNTLLGDNNEESSDNYVPPLTKREKEVLELVAAEYTTKEIAEKLFLSFETIQTHRKHLIQKFNAKNIVGVVKKAADIGLL